MALQFSFIVRFERNVIQFLVLIRKHNSHFPLANNSINASNDDMMSARFESTPHKSPSDQYANVQVAMSSNQYAILPSVAKPSTNYASPIDVPIPASDAHYAEFIDAKQLLEMNREAVQVPPPLGAIE